MARGSGNGLDCRCKVEGKSERALLDFLSRSGVVQSVALQTLDLAILVRVQAPEPDFPQDIPDATYSDWNLRK